MAVGTDSLVLVEHKVSSLWITFNRPGAKNALRFHMLEAVGQALSRAWESTSIQVIVLRGSGDCFSAGLDLNDLFASRESAAQLFRGLCDTCLALRRTRQAVVASIDGPCIAGGLQLAASCDLIIASDRAEFQSPGAKLGFLHSSPAMPLMRLLPEKMAMEFLLLADSIPAQRAREMGLVNWVVPAATLHDETEALVRRLCSRLEMLRGDGKAGLYEQAAMDDEKAYAFLIQKMLTAWDTGRPKKLAEKLLDKTL